MDCNKVVTITQISGTCWFNAILMSLFYCDKMRDLMYLKQKDWKINRGLKVIFKNMMKRNYKYSYDIPEHILNKLFAEEPDNFHFNPKYQSGHFAMDYLPKLLKYLSVDNVLILDCYKNNLYYSVYHGTRTYENDKLKILNPQKSYKPLYVDYDVIIIDFDQDNTAYISTDKTNIFSKNCNIQQIIKHNGYSYKLDSLLLINFNYKLCNKTHQICCITCNNKRYIYNGWIKNYSKIKKPSIPKTCELINYDWLCEKGKFCLSTSQCCIDPVVSQQKSLCFDVHKGPRTYIYVRIHNP